MSARYNTILSEIHDDIGNQNNFLYRLILNGHMASFISTKLSKSNYHNWVKATLALLLTKEGIEPFVYQEIQQFHLKCLDDICYDNGLINGASCFSCCTENVVPCPTTNICHGRRRNCSFHRNVATYYKNAGCPSKICHHFKDKIQHSHRHKGPSYKNTDATQWCSNPWEVAKCFMPLNGYKDVTSPAETDFNGINSIIINHIDIQKKITNRNIFETARTIGNEVRHSPTLEIDATTLQRLFNELNSLLSDSAYLAKDMHAQKAQRELQQLQNDMLPLGEAYFRKVLDEAAKVIKEDIKNETDESKEQQKQENLKLLEVSKKKIKTLFNDKGKRVYSQIEKTLSLAVNEIEQKKSEALFELAKANKELQKNVEEMRLKASKGVKRTANDEVRKAESKIQEIVDKQVKKLKQSDNEKEVTRLKIAGDTRYDESDIQKTKRAIDKAWGNFIDYMEPDPILDCVIEIDLFEYRETRDIKEEKNTTEKNRRILEKVRSKGNTGYEKFKDCLHKTDQSILVKLLESIEREEDTSSLLQQIKEKKTMKETLL